jgi:hypothetical protein
MEKHRKSEKVKLRNREVGRKKLSGCARVREIYLEIYRNGERERLVMEILCVGVGVGGLGRWVWV